MDAFFASVEQRDNSALRGRPVAVGGGHRGVVAAASYEARRFGIFSAMPVSQAQRRCPGLCVVRPRREAYEAASRMAFAIFARYTPLVEPLSLDEAFLDVTGSIALFGDGPTLAARIRYEVAQELNLPCSAGVAPNKFVAKLACDLAKPRGLGVVAPGEVAVFLAKLPIEKIYGVGAVMATRLHQMRVHTLGDAAAMGPTRLQAALGATGLHIAQLAAGLDDRPVVADAARKSISSESTLDADVSTCAQLQRELLRHAMQVAARLGRADLHALAVHIKLKDSDFRIESRQGVLVEPAQDPDSLFGQGCALLRRIPLAGRRFRLCGLGAHDLRPGPPPRGLFADPERDRRHRVEAARAQIARRFGDGSLTRASLVAPLEAGKEQ